MHIERRAVGAIVPVGLAFLVNDRGPSPSLVIAVMIAIMLTYKLALLRRKMRPNAIFNTAVNAL